MKRRFLWIIPILLLIGFIVGLVIWQQKQDARPFKSQDFPKTLIVENATDYHRADTIALVLANKVLHLDTLNLMMVYIPEIINEGETEFYAMVQRLPFKKNQFLLLLSRKNLNLSKLKISLAHEFIHIDQHISGDLVVWGSSATWKGESYVFEENDYRKRPWEREAFSRQVKITNDLKKLLYD